MTGRTVLRNGRVVTPERVIEDGCVVLSGARIAHVGSSLPKPSPEAASESTTIDVGGRIVMPGLVDLHGDDIEHQLHPRSEARVDSSLALVSSDRFNLFNGVTTKFHAIAFEDAPGENRSLQHAADISREIATADYTLGDNRVHARCELTAESVSAVESLLDTVQVDLVSVMHHAPGGAQFDEADFERHYTTNHDCSTAETRELAASRRSTSHAALVDRVDRIAALASDAGIPLASHDDESPAIVDRMANAGVSISEYPVAMAAARRAKQRLLTTVMGAPNLVRGGSLWGNLAVQSAIEESVVDVLCSDYHPPSLLEAPFVETGESLAERVRRVTVNPADAVGLSDRGRIERGARADVLVVAPEPLPTVERVYVAGRDVIRAL